jgi:hypothetical protein
MICMYHYTNVSFQVQPNMMFLHGLDLHHYPRMHGINTPPLHFELPLHRVGEAQGKWLYFYPIKPYHRVPY